MIAAHWRHPVVDYPLSGDAANAVIGATPGLHQMGEYRDDDVVIAVFDTRSAQSVATRTGVAISAIDRSGAILSTGERISAATIVWCAGMRANPLTELFPVRRDRFGRLPVDHFMRVEGMADTFAAGYQPPRPGSGPDPEWFGQVRQLAAELGFAPTPKVYKQDPDAYPGSITHASQIIRVLLTGALRSPDLAEVSRTLGTEEVLRRVRAVSAA